MRLWRLGAIAVMFMTVGSAQAVMVSGVVKNKQTSLPVVGAKVSLAKEGVSGVTDSAGKFSISSKGSDLSDTLVVADKLHWEKKIAVTSANAANLDVNLQAIKQRLIITSDIGGEDPDDRQSMVHAIMLSNEFDLEGIIPNQAWCEAHLARGKERVEAMIAAYEQVLPNLKAHAEGYPEPAYLRSILKIGQATPCLAGTGEGKDSEGSALIIAAVDKKDDPRPVWITAWGGANTIGQAFYKVKATRTPEEVAMFVKKVRVYDVLGQCDSGSWICKTFPDVFYIRNVDGVYGWCPSGKWVSENVQSHGPVGKVYPSPKWAVEGDSPSLFHVSSRGLNDPDEITQGGWGGRFDAEKKTGVKLFKWAMNTPSVAASEAKLIPYGIYTNTAENIAPINKWKLDIYNDFAARMIWSEKANKSEANHFPVAVLNGDATRQIMDMTVTPGQQITLDASASTDPDGNKLQFAWQFYKEPSSYAGTVAIAGETTATAKITVPADAAGKSIHIILVIHDDGTPSLHAYRRMILNVK
jgi:hypothetical protein